MSLTDENMVMPVSPYGGGNGFGGFGNDWASLIVLFLIFGMFNGGWGNGGFGGGFGADSMYPWLVNGQNSITSAVNTGFDNAAVASQLSGIQNSLTTGFSNAEVAGCNRAMDSMQTAYQNQIADLERSYASQTATAQGFTNIQSQLANCCCENRLATAQTQALVQSENCADRQAFSDGIRDVIANQTAGTQKILDMLCQNQLNEKQEKINELQNQLTMAQLAANNNLQTQTLLNDNLNQTRNIETYLNPAPIPAYIVANPNGCGNTYGCGCSGSF